MRKLLLRLSLLFLISDKVFGAIEGPRPPPVKLVEISDCIVIGHAKDDSLDHPVLSITEILKGSPPAKELPIIIPADGSRIILQKNYTIRERGKWGLQMGGDIRQDQIWFLRTEPKGYSYGPGGTALKVWESGDIQPVELKPFYLALLSDHPEDNLRKYLDGEPILARVCHAYLDPIDIDRISKIPNPADRIDKLIPFLLFRESFNPKENDETVPNSETMPTVSNSYNLRDNDAQRQLILCGNGVGEKLIPIFLDPNYEYMRMEIMTMWAALDYKKATPYVISLLQQEDEHWAHPDVPHPIDNDRANSWSRLRISCALKTLASLRDPRAKAVIMKTKERWVAFGTKDPSQAIVPLCDAALKAIDDQAASR